MKSIFNNPQHKRASITFIISNIYISYESCANCVRRNFYYVLSFLMKFICSQTEDNNRVFVCFCIFHTCHLILPNVWFSLFYAEQQNVRALFLQFHKVLFYCYCHLFSPFHALYIYNIICSFNSPNLWVHKRMFSSTHPSPVTETKRTNIHTINEQTGTNIC